MGLHAVRQYDTTGPLLCFALVGGAFTFLGLAVLALNRINPTAFPIKEGGHLNLAKAIGVTAGISLVSSVALYCIGPQRPPRPTDMGDDGLGRVDFDGGVPPVSVTEAPAAPQPPEAFVPTDENHRRALAILEGVQNVASLKAIPAPNVLRTGLEARLRMGVFEKDEDVAKVQQAIALLPAATDVPKAVTPAVEIPPPARSAIVEIPPPARSDMVEIPPPAQPSVHQRPVGARVARDESKREKPAPGA
jgi:hypothetical protein